MSMAPTRKKEALRSEPCLALIGDMVGSRELLPSRRPKIQERFREFIQYLNKKYAKDILAKFVITLGDEFQGLLLSATDRKSTRLNSSHDQISYAVFCLKKKSTTNWNIHCDFDTAAHGVELNDLY